MKNKQLILIPTEPDRWRDLSKHFVALKQAVATVPIAAVLHCRKLTGRKKAAKWRAKQVDTAKISR